MSEDAKSGDPNPAKEPSDIVFIGGPVSEGAAASVLRLREGRIETGELREAREGKPIVGDLVKLSKRPEHDRLFDVEVLAEGPKPPSSTAVPHPAPHKGPARVASNAYRAGWDAIFGPPATTKPN